MKIKRGDGRDKQQGNTVNPYGPSLTLTILLATIGFSTPTQAANLTIGLNVAPTSMDPYYHHVGQNIGPLSQIFDTLVAQRPDLNIVPSLATSWKALDDTHWEFNLRKGVKFQDGSDFTAEDVIFSIHRVPLVPNSPSSAAIYIKSITAMTVTDPYRVVFTTNAPDPNLAVDLSQILIVSHVAANGPATEGRTTQEFNAGEGVIGTGPYRFVHYTPGDELIVAANADYWGPKQPWDQVRMRVIVNDGSRAAAILAGDIDMTILPGESLDSIKADPKLTVTLGDTCQITYLALDEREASPGVSDAGGRNPLRDARVRRALSLAINRQAIADRVMLGLAKPVAELGPPTLFGADPNAKPDAFDPGTAKQLLTEAGYPNGFGLVLASPNGLFPLDFKISQAIAGMWGRVGVRTRVDDAPGAVFYARRNRLEYSAYATNLNVYNGDLAYSLQVLSMTRDMAKGNGQINLSGYSNPTVDELIAQADVTVDADKRRRLVQQASSIVMQEHQILPIIQHRYAYITRRPLTIEPRLDMFLTAMEVKPMN